MTTYAIPKGNRTDREYFEYCNGLPFSFNSVRTLQIDPAKEQVTLDGSIDGFDIVNTPEAPVIPIILSKITFMNRFTDTELATILTVAKTNIAIEVFVKKLDLADTVTINGADAITGVNAMETYGLIGAGRAAEILTI